MALESSSKCAEAINQRPWSYHGPMRHFIASIVLLAAAFLAFANPPAVSSALADKTAVETRAELRSIVQEGANKRTYVYLKIVPGAKLPFTTHRFRVRDPAMLAGLAAGASVKFRAGRADGENALVSIRAVPACVRFQACD